MIEVVIFGAGNVATHLYQSFSKLKQVDVIQVFNRNPDHLDFVEESSKKVSKIADIKKADLYLLAVKDEVIEELSARLTDQNALIVHTSGSEPMSIFSNFRNYGVFYPLQTFSKNKYVDFSEIPICLEANSDKNLDFLRNLATMLSEKIYEVDSDQRKALHVAAVFVNNFSNHLFALAADYCKENDLPFDILKPLIKETVDKLETLDPYSAQTGPALRNDQKTISAHLSMLNKDQQNIYTILTESIQKLHGKKL